MNILTITIDNDINIPYKIITINGAKECISELQLYDAIRTAILQRLDLEHARVTKKFIDNFERG